ncbi:hypothetical protein DPMN_031159 [Dreissena polymorpha]|uniref:Uncharacterized protein n=1 Tax=Dreissena polymorpha TaxID=45954 RepID=A0A9D4RIS7_DREPO|nr:hypothetical protein DPMN_031159 [Dreissena polymorpha]
MLTISPHKAFRNLKWIIGRDSSKATRGGFKGILISTPPVNEMFCSKVLNVGDMLKSPANSE